MTLVRIPFWLPVLAILVVTGCDPKKLTGTDTGGNTNTTPQNTTVTPEALAVGNILALHVDILRAGLALSAAFDTASAPAATLRGVLSAGCATLTEVDAGLPRWTMTLDGCTDGHGTAYRGTGEFAPIDSLDGFAFLPWFDTDLIRASNDANDDYNHDVHSGSFEIGFVRSSGAVTEADIAKFVRHTVRSDIVTFTYDGVHYTGTPGSFGDYPDSDSVARVVWDSVGIFDVDFLAGGQASYSIAGVTYLVDLSNGDVSVAN